MARRHGFAGLLTALVMAWCAAPALADPSAESPFRDWAAVVVAGDWRAHSGGATEAFDNARRDVSKSLIGAGFDAANLRQFSVRPNRYKDVRALKSDLQGIYDSLVDLTGKARGGCLLYFSSHGVPQGVVIDDRLLPPDMLAAMIDSSCAGRPTVVVLSACFSGVFMPHLAGPNRMILTAARPDRTSFGCGEANVYPYFDECFLTAFPKAGDFARLGPAVQACVAQREASEGASPPSEPQLRIGAALLPMLPLYAFARAPP